MKYLLILVALILFGCNDNSTSMPQSDCATVMVCDSEDYCYMASPAECEDGQTFIVY